MFDYDEYEFQPRYRNRMLVIMNFLYAIMIILGLKATIIVTSGTLSSDVKLKNTDRPEINNTEDPSKTSEILF